MHDDVEALRDHLAGAAPLDLSAALEPQGAVDEVGDDVAQVLGLEHVGYEELVIFDSGVYGMAYDLAPTRTGVVLLSNSPGVHVGEGARTTGTLPVLPVGPALLGRIVDSLGNPLDDLPRPSGEPAEVFRPPPVLTERASVNRSLHTGIMAIDAAIPIGRGQRQLILGDRNTGKTALAEDIVVAQRDTGVICVYVVVGQPLTRVLAMHASLHTQGALDHTVIVAAQSSAPHAMQYLAPYAGMAVAEYFRDRGRDVVIAFDDLTKHADAYRELALLLGRPPGREAFPGDIFYVHGELLERASAFAAGGSITAFPIVETTDNDISTYIPTNLISITDGQVYLDTTRFERNQRPAIDIARSVSRIGGAAQQKVLRAASKNLRIDMARFESLEAITRVGLDVDTKTRAALDRGLVMRELLRQPRFANRTVAEQVLALHAVDAGWLADVEPLRAPAIVWAATQRAREEFAELVHQLDQGEIVDDDSLAALEPLFRPDAAHEDDA